MRRAPLALVAATLLGGCISSAPPPPPVAAYELAYTPPAFSGRQRLEATVEVVLSPSEQALSGEDMVYATTPYRRLSYTYGRWASPPADLVTARLVSDMEQSGLFTAVFSSHAGTGERFLVIGTVDEFREADDAGKGRARLGLSVALVDTAATTGRSYMFQRRYDAQGPALEQTPDGLAASMSQAMADLSRQLIGDIYDAISVELTAP